MATWQKNQDPLPLENQNSNDPKSAYALISDDGEKPITIRKQITLI